MKHKMGISKKVTRGSDKIWLVILGGGKQEKSIQAAFVHKQFAVIKCMTLPHKTNPISSAFFPCFYFMCV